MARLHTVTARKPNKCGSCGAKIKPGETYFWWANRIGRSSSKKVRCAAHKPKPSEMVSSDKMSRIMAAQESVEAVLYGEQKDFESFQGDVAQALRDAASEIRETGEEYGESFDNMPEGLQQGDTGMRDGCEQWADSLESAADEIEGLTAEDTEPQDGEEAEVDYQPIIDLAEAALGEISV